MTAWVQLTLSSDTDGSIFVSMTNTSSGRRCKPRMLDEFGVDDIDSLADQIARAAIDGKPLHERVLRRTRRLYEDVFAGEVGEIFNLERGAAGREPIHLRIDTTGVLVKMPWEAMRGPGDNDGHIGVNARILVSRLATSSLPATPRELDTSLDLLTIASEDHLGAVEDLEAQLVDPIATGHVRMLAPLVGAQARFQHLQRRLKQAPQPHVLHAVLHGRVGPSGPQLQLHPADATGWTDVEVLAQAFSNTLFETRLVYLEACSGADPGTQASAAELFAARGVDAVVAHLWPIRADVARQIARAVYDELIAGSGDVAKALTDARLVATQLHTAEFLGPVVYLRNGHSTLFELATNWKPRTPEPTRSATSDGDAQRRRQLRELFEEGATLVLGEQFASDATSRLEETVRNKHQTIDGPTVFSKTQQVVFETSNFGLERLVESVLDEQWSPDATRADRRIHELASMVRPGLVITLHWMPWFERALAERHPDRDIIVLQPSSPDQPHRPYAYRRRAGQDRFEYVDEDIDFADALDRHHVVMHVYGGYELAKNSLHGRPVLTEDNLLDTLRMLDQLPNALKGRFKDRPAVLAGLSANAWAHREMLRRLTDNQPLRFGSIIGLLEEQEQEATYWEARDGPAGGATVEVWTHEQLSGALLTGQD